jgi:hypothetical protein
VWEVFRSTLCNTRFSLSLYACPSVV